MSVDGSSIDLGDTAFAGPDISTNGGSSTSSTSTSKTTATSNDAVASAIGHISVPFLAINIIGSGLVLFVGNLWSQVFGQWINEVQESPIFNLQDSSGDIVQTTDVTTSSSTDKKPNVKKGLIVALIATFVAIFIIWLLLKFYKTSKDEIGKLKTIVRL